MAYFWIAAGSALGGMFRYRCSGVRRAADRRDVSVGYADRQCRGSFVTSGLVTLEKVQVIRYGTPENVA